MYAHVPKLPATWPAVHSLSTDEDICEPQQSAEQITADSVGYASRKARLLHLPLLFTSEDLYSNDSLSRWSLPGSTRIELLFVLNCPLRTCEEYPLWNSPLCTQASKVSTSQAPLCHRRNTILYPPLRI